MSENDERQQQILSAAATVIIRQGYDKTTMSDIAEEAGVSRGTIYLYFEGKEELFEVLIYSEVMQYGQTWLEHIETNPQGGTIGGIYRAVLYAINSRPLMSTIMRRDRRVFGSYLRKPNTLFSSMQTAAINVDFLRALQNAGAVRQDVDPAVMSHIMDLIGYGLVTISEFRQPEDMPPFEVVMETLADMLDRLLTPENGGDSEAGKAVIRQLAAASHQNFEQRQDKS